MHFCVFSLVRSFVRYVIYSCLLKALSLVEMFRPGFMLFGYSLCSSVCANAIVSGSSERPPAPSIIHASNQSLHHILCTHLYLFILILVHSIVINIVIILCSLTFILIFVFSYFVLSNLLLQPTVQILTS